MEDFKSKYKIELFDGKANFSLWQSAVKDILIHQGLHKTLEDKKLDSVDNDKWEDMQLCATSTIRLALAPEIKYNVLGNTNPKVLWDKLTKMYASKPLANKLFLKKDLYSLDMEEDGVLQDHLNKFNGLITQLTSLDVKIEEEDKAILLLASLPSKCNNVITSLLVGKTTIALDEAVVALLEAERFMKQ